MLTSPVERERSTVGWGEGSAREVRSAEWTLLSVTAARA
jgi:hypothetical protein